MKIYMIAAIAKNNAIGKDNRLLWNIPEDLKHFKKTTTGHAVLMGLNTWDSLPFKPLKNRKNFVLCPEGTEIDCPNKVDVELVHDANKFIERTDIEDVFIIGGASVYKLFIDKADELFLTIIDKEFEADAFFPEFDESKYEKHKLDHIDNQYTATSDLDYSFWHYVRK